MKKTSKNRFIKQIKPWFGLVVIVCCLNLLSGCGDARVGDHHDEYLTRLARVLEQDLSDWQASARELTQLRYPDVKDRTWQISDTRVGIFDFLALDECNLLPLVSERNSSLGRLMSATSRYQYETMILQGVEQCIIVLSDQPDEAELVVKLNAVLTIKQEEISRHYWNATWGSSEFQQYFSLSWPELSMQEAQGLRHLSVKSLSNYLLNLLPAEELAAEDVSNKEVVLWRAGVFQQSAELENYLQPLQYHYGGRLLKSLAMATAAMKEATRLINKAVSERPICFDNKPSQKGQILNNILNKFYVLALQPYLSRIDKEAAFLQEVLLTNNPRQLSHSKTHVLEFYDFYLGSDNSLGVLDEFRLSLKTHAQTWSDLLAHCGLRVGGTP